MSVFQPTTTDEWVRSQTKEVQRLGRRGRGAITSGTTESRNNQFPAPTTAAERVALANRQVIWYNTELGYQESYFSNVSDPGASLINSALTAGWYPTGTRLPHLRLDYGRLVLPNFTTAETVIGTSGIANNVWEETYDPHGWFTPTGAANDPSRYRIFPQIEGEYRVFFHSQWNTGAGTFWSTVRKNSGTAAPNDGYTRMMGVNASAVLGQPVETVGNFYMNGSTDHIEATVKNGAAANGVGRGFITIEYVRPIQRVWA